MVLLDRSFAGRKWACLSNGTEEMSFTKLLRLEANTEKVEIDNCIKVRIGYLRFN